MENFLAQVRVLKFQFRTLDGLDRKVSTKIN